MDTKRKWGSNAHIKQSMTKDKEGHYLMKKELIQEDIKCS